MESSPCLRLPTNEKHECVMPAVKSPYFTDWLTSSLFFPPQQRKVVVCLLTVVFQSDSLKIRFRFTAALRMVDQNPSAGFCLHLAHFSALSA